MALTILNVAYPLAAIGLNAIGGAEQVLTQIDAALMRAGHRSIVVAREGSQCQGTLVPLPASQGCFAHYAQPEVQAQCRHAIASALVRWPIDVVHLHGIDFYAYLPPRPPPTLVTLHLPLAWYPAEAFAPRANTFLHCVSASQRRQCPPGVALLPEIENGVPVETLTARHGKRRFVVALGRICPEKGFHLAIDAAKRAGMPLLLGGRVFGYTQHEEYFRAEIVPRLDAQRRYVGPLGLVRKRRLLTAARALLVPSLAPETSSLVAMEAMACGTPVIAFRAGALADLVEPGVTGFLVDDVAQMAEAIDTAAHLDPDVCRAVARRRFSVETMTARYLTVYHQLAAEYRTSQLLREEASYAA